MTHGSSFGTTSPGSKLPRQVSTLSSVTSSWAFSVGGTAADHYDVAYDIWFCPNNSCGAGGFNGGLELMIWLDYQNATGWEYDLGSVNLNGFLIGKFGRLLREAGATAGLTSPI